MEQDYTATDNVETGGVSQFLEAEIVPESSPYWGPWATIGFTLALVVACLVVDTIVTVAFVVPAMVGNPKLASGELTAQLQSSGLLLSVGTLARVVCCLTLIPLFIVARRRLTVGQYLGLARIIQELWNLCPLLGV